MQNENKNDKPYFDPVSEGVCEVLDCSNRATYRATWSQGIAIRRVCSTHKVKVEDKSFAEVVPSVFGSNRHETPDINRFRYR